MSSRFDKASDPELAERLYTVSLDSFQDDSIGDVEELGWYGRFNPERAILEINNDGFVTVDTFETDEALETAWADIQQRYVEFDADEASS